MFNPFISIVVRTKNEDHWIGKCLNEIFNQQYKNFEVILVDSGSTDTTIAIAKEFKLKILHITQSDFTFGKSLNLGCNASSGDILVFLFWEFLP